MKQQYKNVLVFAGRPTLSLAAAGYLLYTEEDIRNIIVLPAGEKLKAKPGYRYFVIGKITLPKQQEQSYEIITFFQEPADAKDKNINSNFIIFNNVKNYILTQAQKVSKETVYSLSFMVNFLQKIVFNNASEYSLLKSYYTLYETKYDPSKAVKLLFGEFEKITEIAKYTYLAKLQFEKEPNNYIIGTQNLAFAINYSGQNPYLYRYLFETVDVILYVEKNEKKIGILCNKKIGPEKARAIIESFVEKYKKYNPVKSEINAYFKIENEQIDDIVKQISEFLIRNYGG